MFCRFRIDKIRWLIIKYKLYIMNVNINYRGIAFFIAIHIFTFCVGYNNGNIKQTKEKYLTYELFGAKGDGVTDDFNAIIKTHNEANKRGLPVRANDKSTYYIGPTIATAIVQTDVDFGKARFIIDDSNVDNSQANRSKDIFSIQSKLKPFSITGITNLKKGQKSLGKTLPYRCLVKVVNDDKRIYIRGYNNPNSGVSLQEYILVERDGAINEKSALTWDYDNITSITAYPIDDSEIVVKGGIFTTIANRAPSEYAYYSRGLDIRRSNVRIENISHYVKEEGIHGAPYRGFFSFNNAAYILACNLIYTGHKMYKNSAGVPMGSYDLNAAGCINVMWKDCRQSNDFTDTKYWGVMGSNFCKDLKLDNCVISRFDAHQGVRNVTLTNSTFGHMGIRLVGAGTIRIENCEVRNNNLVILRRDYGSSWDGDIIIKNSTLIPVNNNSNICIVDGENLGKHNFGNTCYLPSNITVEGLTIKDSCNIKDLYIWSDFKCDLSSPYLKSYMKGGNIIVTDIISEKGKVLNVSPNSDMFKNYHIVVNGIIK